MRRFLKFLHTMGATGLLGSIASLLVLLIVVPPAPSLAAYASFRETMSLIGTWVFLPSLGLTLISGLLAIAATPAYHNAGWAWVKAVSGILMFESGFMGVLGPLQQEAERASAALAAKADPSTLAHSFSSERNTIAILIAIAVFNVAFGIWRPRLTRIPN
ncbi:hypothetical protein [Aestuariivirga sp.]|uniref:hypothetical protein n=1 Tax=Aestuariivirga sp. TaxID=2650926 RepID=UPI0039E5E198